MARYRTPQLLISPIVYLTFYTSLQIKLLIAGLGLLVVYQASYSYLFKMQLVTKPKMEAKYW
jgi:hypothetical protein